MQIFLAVVAVQALTFVPTLDSLAQKLDLQLDHYTRSLSGLEILIRPEVARAAEIAISGFSLPILVKAKISTQP